MFAVIKWKITQNYYLGHSDNLETTAKDSLEDEKKKRDDSLEEFFYEEGLEETLPVVRQYLNKRCK